MDVYLSTSKDAISNLALEEIMLNRSHGCLLLLYENNPTVVIGRFQNPWRECRIGLAKRKGVPILRRISGGGTVIHGPGNLNWSIISPGHLSGKEQNCQRMIQALDTLGLTAVKNSRHDILLPFQGYLHKISGSAFRQTSQGNLHHATLLVNTNLYILNRLLDVPARDMDNKGVISIRSAVINLVDLAPHLTVDDVVRAIAGEWSGQKTVHRISPGDFVSDADFIHVRDRLGSQAWTWDKTAPFVERFSNLPGCPGRTLECEIESGHIHHISLDGEDWDMAWLIGRRYSRDGILAGLKPGFPIWLESFAARVESDNEDSSLH